MIMRIRKRGRSTTAYKSQTDIDAATFICSIGDGAGIES